LPPFQLRHTDIALLGIVRTVSRHARRDDPLACTQAQFDAHAWAAGYDDVPQARSIAARLRMDWRRVLVVAHSPEEHWPRALSTADVDRSAHRISLEQALVALRHVSVYRASQELTRGAYATAREEIVAPGRRAYKHGGRGEHTLPTLNQIDSALDAAGVSWNEALERAGLRAPVWRKRGLRPDEAVSAFAEATGYVPRHYHQMRQWAWKAGVLMGVFPSAEARAAIDALQNARAADGQRPLPEAPKDLVDSVQRTEQPIERRAPRRGALDTREAVVRALATATFALQPGERLGQKSVNRIARDVRSVDVLGWGPTPVPMWKTVAGKAKKFDSTTDQLRAEAVQLADAHRRQLAGS
jgi:hypothetical protein